MKKTRSRRQPGIALFLLLTALIIISLAMQDLLQGSRMQVERVRNAYDRMQANYLAHSSLNLARFFLLLNTSMKSVMGDQGADTKLDIWARPLPFPIPFETVTAMTGQFSEEELGRDEEEHIEQCRDFFNDFPGDAMTEISDLSARINLNDLDVPVVQDVFRGLLMPDYDFADALDQRGIQPDEVVRQMTEYIGPSDAAEQDEEQENEFEQPAPEEQPTADLLPYTRENLEYGPKFRPFVTRDELKLIPSVDDELYEYLEQFTTAVYFPQRQKPAKINLNTVEAEVFQALLGEQVSDPLRVAEEFITDREENNRVYTDQNIEEQLELFGFTAEQVPTSLLTGQTDAFLVETDVTVNRTQLNMEAIVRKPGTSGADRQPIVQIRISP